MEECPPASPGIPERSHPGGCPHPSPSSQYRRRLPICAVPASHLSGAGSLPIRSRFQNIARACHAFLPPVHSSGASTRHRIKPVPNVAITSTTWPVNLLHLHREPVPPKLGTCTTPQHYHSLPGLGRRPGTDPRTNLCRPIHYGQVTGPALRTNAEVWVTLTRRVWFGAAPNHMRKRWQCPPRLD